MRDFCREACRKVVSFLSSEVSSNRACQTFFLFEINSFPNSAQSFLRSCRRSYRYLCVFTLSSSSENDEHGHCTLKRRQHHSDVPMADISSNLNDPLGIKCGLFLSSLNPKFQQFRYKMLLRCSRSIHAHIWKQVASLIANKLHFSIK